MNIGFDYYWKQTRDLLYNATLPPSSGYSSMLRNLGRIDNKGFEISINTINMRGKVNWTTNLNITSNKSVVKDLGTDVYGNKIMRIDAPIGGGNWFPLFVGKAPFQLYGYEIEGIYQTDEEARSNGEATKKPVITDIKIRMEKPVLLLVIRPLSLTRSLNLLSV